MTGRHLVKVPGGKLLRIEVEVEGGRLLRVLVRGDFFAHPEELFEEAEASLAGLAASEVPARALAAFSRPGLVVHGASALDISEAIRKAIDAAQTP